MQRIDFLRTMGIAGVGMGIPGLVHGMTESNTLDLPPLLVDSKGKPINSVSKWEKQSKKIKKRWLEYLGALDMNPGTPVLKVLEEDVPRPCSVRRPKGDIQSQ